MSLRRDIHSAFESIAPPLGGMPERVVQTVLADDRRRRKVKVVFRLRVSLALVAAVLLVAVVAAAIITWNSLHPSNVSPAGVAPSHPVANLEARPLHVAQPKSLADCVTGPNDAWGGGFGSGPVYAHGGPATSTAWGYFHVYAYTRNVVAGPVLVRAKHLFDSNPVVFVGPNAAGPVLGTDTVDGALVVQHVEAVIMDTTVSAKDPGSPWLISKPYRNFWPLISAEPSSSSGSTGWQIDGPSFSETFVVC